MTDLKSLMRPHLVQPETYSSVNPVEEQSRLSGLPPEAIVRLNANENPFGTTETVREALKDIPLHLYPDPNQRRLRAALAAYTSQPPECILVGAGADELIDLPMRLFLNPNDSVIDCDPTFGVYRFLARVCGAPVVSVPRDHNWEVNVDSVIQAANPLTKIIFIASPNNPTGNLLPEPDARRLLELGILVIIDETYGEFAGQTFAHLLSEYNNLAIIRSFSKWAGIAGLRVGYMIASPVLISHLIDIKQPYNVNIAAEAAVLAALDDTEGLFANIRVLVAQRKRLERAIDKLAGVSYWPSSGNFLLCKFDCNTAKSVFENLAARGLFVRYFDHPRLQNCLRMSAGTPVQTGKLIDALNEIM